MSNRKAPFWETPRNVAVLLGAVAVIAGYLGYTTPQPPALQIVFPTTLHITLEYR